MPVVIQNENNGMLERFLMQMMQQQEEQRRYREDVKRADTAAQQQSEAARLKAIADQFRALAPEQQQAVWPTLPEGAKQFALDPGVVPLSTEQQFKQKVLTDSNERFGQTPDYLRDAGTYQSAYGAAIPKETNTTLIEQRTLAPEQFQKSREIDAGLQMNATDTATTGETKRHNIVGEGFEGVKTQAQAANQYAGATANRALAGKYGAEAANVGKPKPGAATATGEPTAGDQATLARSERITASVTELMPRVGAMTVGPGAALMVHVPGTPAANFAADLESLKANIAFGELQEMRNASKTGGALGNVSDTETKLLASSLAGLDQNQSPQNMRKNLARIAGIQARWREAKARNQQEAAALSGGAAKGTSIIRYDEQGRRVQ